jgi:hypothetical protein
LYHFKSSDVRRGRSRRRIGGRICGVGIVEAVGSLGENSQVESTEEVWEAGTGGDQRIKQIQDFSNLVGRRFQGSRQKRSWQILQNGLVHEVMSRNQRSNFLRTRFHDDIFVISQGSVAMELSHEESSAPRGKIYSDQ